MALINGGVAATTKEDCSQKRILKRDTDRKTE